MFASDRTCCVCRREKDRVQIHHIDEDPSNNTFDNLAVVCLHCHSDTQRTGGFVRGVNAELVRLYNSSWRDVVKLRLKPPAEVPGKLELASEAFLEASLDCHRWRLDFIELAGPNLPSGSPGAFPDIWGLMVELWNSRIHGRDISAIFATVHPLAWWRRAVSIDWFSSSRMYYLQSFALC
jgi:hypothetical protein